MEATDTDFYGSRFLPETLPGTPPETRLGRDCVISRRDLEVLLHGSETEREKGYRNLAGAVTAGAGLGVLSTVISHFGELLTVGLSPAEGIFLVLMLSTTMASSVLAAFFHRRVRRTGAADHQLLNHHIRDQLEAAADDPRRWP